jgi:hypothetical protein
LKRGLFKDGKDGHRNVIGNLWMDENMPAAIPESLKSVLSAVTSCLYMLDNDYGKEMPFGPRNVNPKLMFAETLPLLLVH